MVALVATVALCFVQVADCNGGSGSESLSLRHYRVSCKPLKLRGLVVFTGIVFRLLRCHALPFDRSALPAPCGAGVAGSLEAREWRWRGTRCGSAVRPEIALQSRTGPMSRWRVSRYGSHGVLSGGFGAGGVMGTFTGLGGGVGIGRSAGGQFFRSSRFLSHLGVAGLRAPATVPSTP